jgi:hypothetical protein
MSSSRTLMVAIVFLGATGGKAVSQENVSDTLSRAAICERATKTLHGQPTAVKYSGTVSELPACHTAGVKELRAQWAHPPRDTAAVRVLGEVTPQLRDRDLFETVLAAYRDASRPQQARLAALVALVGYYQPGLGLVFVEPKVPVQDGSAYVRVSYGDPATTKGPSPLSAGTRGQILAALDEVGKRDSDERLRSISAYIHTRLAALS